MGQFSCKGWDCKNSDAKNDEEFRTSVRNIKDFNIAYQGKVGSLSAKPMKIDYEYYSCHIKQVIKAQSFSKRIVYRLRYLAIIKSNFQIFSYFNFKEVTHFLSKTRAASVFHETVFNKTYNFGGFYSGDMLGGFRDGKGIMKWKDGAEYNGNWAYGRPFGTGIFIFPDGDSYQGLWKFYFSKGNENDISGLGRILWRENVTDGYKWLWYKKVISISSPRSVAVTPRNEEKLVEIEEKYIQLKMIFEKHLAERLSSKDFKERKYPDGSVYIGDLQGSQKHGYGKLTWGDGDVYEGQWKNDIQSGWGKNFWKEGSSYCGFFSNNVKEGIGQYFWHDKTEYFGEWKGNKIHGIGKYKWNDGKIYLGEWVEGNMQGIGVIMWKDGRKYEGGWHEGKKHGEGVTFYTNGRVSRDLWRHGKIIKPDV